MLIVEFADPNLAKGTTNPPHRQQPCSKDEALRDMDTAGDTHCRTIE
jgi:hypothetical protein